MGSEVNLTSNQHVSDIVLMYYLRGGCCLFLHALLRTGNTPTLYCEKHSRAFLQSPFFATPTRLQPVAPPRHNG